MAQASTAEDRMMRTAATCVSIALIKSPSYPGHWDLSLLLSRFFTRPKVVRKDQVFSVSTRLAPELCNQVDDVSLLSLPPVIFFKVVHIECSPRSGDSNHIADLDSDTSVEFLVQKGKSRLLQLPAIHCLLPKSIFTNEEEEEMIPADATVLPNLMYVMRPYTSGQMRGPVQVILSGDHGSGKWSSIHRLSRETGLQVYTMDVNLLLMETSVGTEKRLSDALTKALVYSPVIVCVRNAHLLVTESKGHEERYADLWRACLSVRDLNASIFVISCLESEANILLQSHAFAPLMRHTVRIREPDEGTRLKILTQLTTGNNKNNKNRHTFSLLIDLKSIAKRTTGFTAGELSLLVDKAIRMKDQRLQQMSANSKDERESISLSGCDVTPQDMDSCLQQVRKESAKNRRIAAPDIPSVSWDQIGGLDDVRTMITDTILLPLQHPHLFKSSGIRRTGLLFHGPPGTGKTLLAKAVATECGTTFLSVKGPELISMFVGQSEANVRSVFARGRASTPCVLFFDELDSLAPNRGRAGDSGGVMDRVVSQLLAELDNMPDGLFIIGATNRPDLIDPALLRPGRFDKMIHVSVPSDPEDRIKVLKALVKQFDVHPSVDLPEIERISPSGMSGADFYSLVSGAMNSAIGRSVTCIEEGTVTEEEALIQLTRQDFETAIRQFQSS